MIYRLSEAFKKYQMSLLSLLSCILPVVKWHEKMEKMIKWINKKKKKSKGSEKRQGTRNDLTDNIPAKLQESESTAKAGELARGKKQRARADWNFWGSLHFDMATRKRRKGIRKNINKMIFG